MCQDYLVDLFPLWTELPTFNEITANAKIVMILHCFDLLRIVFNTVEADKLLGLADA